MAYAVLRCSKVSTLGGVKALSDHIDRSRETLNADPKGEVVDLSNLLSYKYSSQTCLYDAVSSALPKERRKNAVLMVEHLLTASPEYFEGLHDAERWTWAKKSLQWAKQRYGEDNVVSATLHLDEKTPHLHIAVVPLVNGKLNARHLFGGREKLSSMQDDYAKAMEGFGLERGVKGSKAKHIDIQKFYTAINDFPAFLKEINASKPRKNGALDLGYDKRLLQWYRDEIMPVANKNLGIFKTFLEMSTANIRSEKEKVTKEKNEAVNERENMLEDLKKANQDVSRLSKAFSDKSKEVDSVTSLSRKQQKYIETLMGVFQGSLGEGKLTMDEVKKWVDSKAGKQESNQEKSSGRGYGD